MSDFVEDKRCIYLCGKDKLFILRVKCLICGYYMLIYGRICYLDLICMLIFDFCEILNIEIKKDKCIILWYVGLFKNIDNVGIFFIVEVIKFLLRIWCFWRFVFLMSIIVFRVMLYYDEIFIYILNK